MTKNEVYTITLRDGPADGTSAVRTRTTSGNQVSFWIQNPNAHFKRYKIKLANFYVNNVTVTADIPPFLEFCITNLSSTFNFDSSFNTSSLGVVLNTGSNDSYISRPSFNFSRILNYPQSNIFDVSIQLDGVIADTSDYSGWVAVLELIPFD